MWQKSHDQIIDLATDKTRWSGMNLKVSKVCHGLNTSCEPWGNDGHRPILACFCWFLGFFPLAVKVWDLIEVPWTSRRCLWWSLVSRNHSRRLGERGGWRGAGTLESRIDRRKTESWKNGKNGGNFLILMIRSFQSLFWGKSWESSSRLISCCGYIKYNENMYRKISITPWKPPKTLLSLCHRKKKVLIQTKW